MRLSIIGTGHVGLVAGACLADLGHTVVCVDNDEVKVAHLQEGTVDIYEPGLLEMVERTMSAGRLSFTGSIALGIQGSEVVFICVGTPSLPDGSANMSYVESVSREVAQNLDGYTVIAEKSTVPVATGQRIQETVRLYAPEATVDVATVPEFLREGTAVQDFLHPDRIVLGVESPRAETILRELFDPLDAPILVTDIKSAELIKHASNGFLAMRISYINAIAAICDRVGADVSKVAEGMGYDPRIGRSYLNAGVGYGGSCFPKDVAAFAKIAEQMGYDFRLLREVERINLDQRARLVHKIRDLLWVLQGKDIGVLGLAFKANTNDLRDAPALEIIAMLQQEGANVRVYDPVAMGRARTLFGDEVQYCPDPYDAARDADALVILTEWEEFRHLDLGRLKEVMRVPVVVDGRNLLDPEEMRACGFQYQGMGR